MDLIKLMCHCCKRFTSSEFIVPCKTPGCNLLFCNRCLTSRFKYSHAKADRLPTAHWKCPVCTHKCKCDICQPEEHPKPVKEDSTIFNSFPLKCHRKKRIRKPNFPFKIEPSAKTLISEKGTNEVCSPISLCSLPSVSGIIKLTSLVFLRDKKEIIEEKPQIEQGLKLMPAENYEMMTAIQLLSFASIPISFL